MADVLGSPQSRELDEREVARAALEAAEEQLQSLCASHAGTFVSVERRGKALEEGLRDLQDAIKQVQSQVEGAQHALDQEEEDDGRETSLAVLSERHRVRRRTLLQHSTLLELLELPSLMDACVRSHLYEEALSIAAFSNTLERRHQDSNQVVTQVILQIRSRQTDLRRILLHQLKSSVTMPQCLEVVTALRRLNSIDLERQSEINLEKVHGAMELRLQVDFLEARDAWLESTAATATTTASGNRTSAVALPSSEQLLDTIERYRTRVFEVATQFNAIFRAQTKSSDSSVSLLSMWMARRVDAFLTLLSSELDLVEDSASLRDALEASVFFANSMGRLGADFTAQLADIFEPKLLALVELIWKHGVEQLQETLRVCREAGLASPLVSQTAEESATMTPPLDDASLQQLDGPQAPPRQLLALPPLARLVNAVLTGLNELRRCLLPGIFAALRTALEKQVIDVVKSELVSHERAVLKPGFRGEAAALREVAVRFKTVFSDTVDPYLRGSLEAAIGNKQGAECLHQIYWDSLKEPEVEEEPEVVEEDGAAEDAPADGEPDGKPDGEQGEDNEAATSDTPAAAVEGETGDEQEKETLDLGESGEAPASKPESTGEEEAPITVSDEEDVSPTPAP